MKNSITINATELELVNVFSTFTGHGHYKITCKFRNTENSETITLSKTTNNMRAFDDATELEGYEKDLALYEIIQYDIESQLEEFVSPLINN